jgi:hypothetical protein
MATSKLIPAMLIVFGAAGLLASGFSVGPARGTPQDYVFAMRIETQSQSVTDATHLPRGTRPALSCDSVYRVSVVAIGRVCRPVQRETVALAD